ATYVQTGVIEPTLGTAPSRVRPYRRRAITRPLVGARGWSLRRGFPYRGCRRGGIFGSDNRQSHACECETSVPVELSSDSQGISVLWDGSISPPTQRFLFHRVSQLLGRSFPKFN